MKTVNTPIGEFKVNTELGNKPANWNPSGMHYKITVTYNKVSRSFDYWDSFHNMQEGIDLDIVGALYCFLDESFSGMYIYSVDDVASEFGYDKPSEAIRVYRGLKSMAKKAAAMGLDGDNLPIVLEYFRDDLGY